MPDRSITTISAELDSLEGESLASFVALLQDDDRPGVRRAIGRALRRQYLRDRESERLITLARAECELIDAGMLLVAGVDEVGRGALAGPVTACACVFDRDVHIPGINDSKRLSPAARERLAIEIRRFARGVAVAHVEPSEIDRVGIAAATTTAMRRALAALPEQPDHVIVDGLPVDLGYPATAIVSGDALTRAIGAASIVAKVTRDRLMADLEALYPGYGLAENKGYGSSGHMDAIRHLGPSPVHRMSFAPCSNLSLF